MQLRVCFRHEGDEPSKHHDAEYHKRCPHCPSSNFRNPYLGDHGAAKAERLDCSPPTLENRVQPPAGSLRDFRKCRTMLLVGGFSRSSVPTLPHFTITGSLRPRPDGDEAVPTAGGLPQEDGELRRRRRRRRRRRQPGVQAQGRRMEEVRGAQRCRLRRHLRVARHIATRCAALPKGSLPMALPSKPASTGLCVVHMYADHAEQTEWKTRTANQKPSSVSERVAQKKARYRPKNARQFSDLRVEAMRELMGMSRSPLVLPRFKASDRGTVAGRRMGKSQSCEDAEQFPAVPEWGWGKLEIPEKTRLPTASSDTIPTCENLVTRPGFEPGSPWWEASRLLFSQHRESSGHGLYGPASSNDVYPIVSKRLEFEEEHLTFQPEVGYQTREVSCRDPRGTSVDIGYDNTHRVHAPASSYRREQNCILCLGLSSLNTMPSRTQPCVVSQDCVVSKWSPWHLIQEGCVASNGNGKVRPEIHERKRQVVKLQQGDGQPCPHLVETRQITDKDQLEVCSHRRATAVGTSSSFWSSGVSSLAGVEARTDLLPVVSFAYITPRRPHSSGGDLAMARTLEWRVHASTIDMDYHSCPLHNNCVRGFRLTEVWRGVVVLRYRWLASKWSPCVVTSDEPSGPRLLEVGCGGGVQLRDVTCVSVDSGRPVLQELCESLEPLPTVQRVSQNHTIDTHETPYDRVKRCRAPVTYSVEVWRGFGADGVKRCEYAATPKRKGGENGRSPRIPAYQRHRLGTIPTCENPGATLPEIEPGSPLTGGQHSSHCVYRSSLPPPTNRFHNTRTVVLALGDLHSISWWSMHRRSLHDPFAFLVRNWLCTQVRGGVSEGLRGGTVGLLGSVQARRLPGVQRLTAARWVDPPTPALCYTCCPQPQCYQTCSLCFCSISPAVVDFNRVLDIEIVMNCTVHPNNTIFLHRARTKVGRVASLNSNKYDFSIYRGATVAERLARWPPTKANRAQSPAGSPDFRKWESCWTMPLVGGFSRESPVSPPPNSDSAPNSLQSPSSALKTSLFPGAATQHRGDVERGGRGLPQHEGGAAMPTAHVLQLGRGTLDVVLPRPGRQALRGWTPHSPSHLPLHVVRGEPRIRHHNHTGWYRHGGISLWSGSRGTKVKPKMKDRDRASSGMFNIAYYVTFATHNMAADLNNRPAHAKLKEACKASASLGKRGEDRLLPLHHLLPPWLQAVHVSPSPRPLSRAEPLTLEYTNSPAGDVSASHALVPLFIPGEAPFHSKTPPETIPPALSLRSRHPL
ncbi:hypothetical protein PR048_000656 [Dryococelus australis]|uniref:Uncharacterized protein n=1 Tax=Dryococelus australis TaxID=614101 RepID=A0ABQ9IGN6_9NEOP|nr:hypothetical protein PR048_000656 [Dryococelus australis]